MAFGNEEGHAIVYGVEGCWCCGREDGERACFEGVVLFPEAGGEQEGAPLVCDVEGLFCVGQLLPFVVAGHGYEAASSFGGYAKGGFFDEGFASRVDHAVGEFLVFRPGWQQSPSEEVEVARAVERTSEDGRAGGWRDIVVRLPLFIVHRSQQGVGEFGSLRGEVVASTHRRHSGVAGRGYCGGGCAA